MLNEILKKFPQKKEYLIAILTELQQQKAIKKLDSKELKKVAEYLNMPEAELFAVASFYSMFSLNEGAKYKIRVCNSTNCYLHNSIKILNLLKKELKLNENGVTEDNKIIVESVQCLGYCNHSPVMLINDKIFGDLTEEKIGNILNKIKNDELLSDDIEKDIILNSEGLRLLANIKRNKIQDVENHIGIEALKIAIEKKSPNQILDEIKQSKLRGRGGAGFPTGIKWSFTAPLEGEKFIICNGDEGEPGTFKDRVLMENDPILVISGLIIGGYAIGAKKGYFYIRGEYFKAHKIIMETIEVMYKKNLLGKNILGSNFSFDIEVKSGAGSYVVGEETALINSIEGKRGNPRIKPPYPAISGLYQKPSVVNNVETLANVPLIIKNGVKWFKSVGSSKSPGTKLFLLIGKVKNRGILEVPLGTSLREIIYHYGSGIKDGNKFKAVLVGGASGGFIGKKHLDIPMEYDTLLENGFMLGSGSLLVLNDKDNLHEILINIMEFFKHESCGQCAPCRLGNPQILNLLKNLKESSNKREIIKKILNIARVMRETSLCPLGQSPYMPLNTAFEQFEQELIGE